jgi:hypothetical protein
MPAQKRRRFSTDNSGRVDAVTAEVIAELEATVRQRANPRLAGVLLELGAPADPWSVKSMSRIGRRR